MILISITLNVKKSWRIIEKFGKRKKKKKDYLKSYSYFIYTIYNGEEKSNK